MTDFLREVAARTQKRVSVAQASQPLSELKRQLKDAPPKRDFAKALKRPRQVALIAELKQASPSAGVIRAESDMAGRLQAYQRGGASALSILTEEEFFHGSPQLLDLGRRSTSLPLLRKDFIVDGYQLFESRRLGADAILLITAILSKDLLRQFLEQAQEAGVDVLTEVHDERELETAVEAGASVIGINNRNLHTLRVDTHTAPRLLAQVPRGHTTVVESGIKEPNELPTLHQAGAHAVLIGETLMRSDNPEAAVRSFVDAGKVPS